VGVTDGVVTIPAGQLRPALQPGGCQHYGRASHGGDP
jgi:hypothetical protein